MRGLTFSFPAVSKLLAEAQDLETRVWPLWGGWGPVRIQDTRYDKNRTEQKLFIITRVLGCSRGMVAAATRPLWQQT